MSEKKALEELAALVQELGYDTPDDRFKRRAFGVIVDIAMRHEKFVADQVREILSKISGNEDVEDSALDRVFARCERMGLIRRTNEFRRSERPDMHDNPLPVWESLLYAHVNGRRRRRAHDKL